MPDRGPISTSECLALLSDGRAQLESLLSRIDDPGRLTADGWSAKDILLHLARWQQRCAGWFEEDVAGGRPERPEPGYTFDQTDELNARDRDAGRTATNEEARQAFADSYERLVAVAQRLTDEDLNGPGRFEWLGFEARHAIAGNSYGHYSDHIGAPEELALTGELTC